MYLPDNTILRSLTRDFTDALGQQMFYWGRDVIHPSGNLLCAHGFEKRASEGLAGTSCYRRPLDGGGFVELHGACVGWYSGDEGTPSFLFVRNRHRCFRYDSGEAPIPGIYPRDWLHPGPPKALYLLSRRFLDWWLDYEEWIAKVTGPEYRSSCHRAFGKLPKSKPWLPPAEALAWIRHYGDNPTDLQRARKQSRRNSLNYR